MSRIRSGQVTSTLVEKFTSEQAAGSQQRLLHLNLILMVCSLFHDVICCSCDCTHSVDNVCVLIVDWLTKLQDAITYPILRTYNIFKKEFRWKNYLGCVKNPQFRNALTTPIEQGLCNVCHVLEDESHFLLQCNMFTDKRTAFLCQI